MWFVVLSKEIMPRFSPRPNALCWETSKGEYYGEKAHESSMPSGIHLATRSIVRGIIGW